MSTASATYEIVESENLRRVERALHITRGRSDWMRRVAVIVAVVYVPLLVVGVGSRLITGEWSHSIASVSTHVRALVAIPLLFFAEHLVNVRAQGAGIYLAESGLVASVEPRYRATVERTVRLRDSVIAESLLFGGAIASTLFASTFAVPRASVGWAVLPSIIVFRFALLRWLWRWGLWFVYLWSLSRLPLALRATHPDRLAGLAPVLGPAYAVSVVVAACSCAISTSWLDSMLLTGQPAETFIGPASLYVVLAIAIVHAPGLVFIGSLYRARKAELARYGALAQRYAEAYEARWMDARGEDALGAADISGLADLGGSYSVVPETRVVPWSPRLVQITVLAALAPMLPLVLKEVGVLVLIKRLGKALL